jgi:hypothetical protein
VLVSEAASELPAAPAQDVLTPDKARAALAEIRASFAAG